MYDQQGVLLALATTRAKTASLSCSRDMKLADCIEFLELEEGFDKKSLDKQFRSLSLK